MTFRWEDNLLRCSLQLWFGFWFWIGLLVSLVFYLDWLLVPVVLGFCFCGVFVWLCFSLITLMVLRGFGVPGWWRGCVGLTGILVRSGNRFGFCFGCLGSLVFSFRVDLV